MSKKIKVHVLVDMSTLDRYMFEGNLKWTSHACALDQLISSIVFGCVADMAVKNFTSPGSKNQASFARLEKD